MPDLTNISSKEYLTLWDTHVQQIIHAAHHFHGVHVPNLKSLAKYAADMADELMDHRQARAQAHIDQIEEEKEAKKTQSKKPKSRAS